MRFLLTGGAGFIGSHTCVALLNAGHDVVVLDNYYNSSPEAPRRVEQITGKKVREKLIYSVSLRETISL